MSEHTFIIGEAGSSHDCDFHRACELIIIAAKAGADACKFQYYSSPNQLALRRKVPLKYLQIYEKYQLPAMWLGPLKEKCDEYNIEFMVTAYLPEDIAVVAPYVRRFKIASFEASDEAFVHAHRCYNKPLIISTGMSEGVWYRHDDTYLHCVSSYPCPIDQANLKVLREEDHLDGYSDHTRHVLTGALAVAAGARVLEVHFRLDDTDLTNPDYATALTPDELFEYIANVELAERMLGSGIKRPQPAEAEMMKYRVQA